jgi:hypothetical protein
MKIHFDRLITFNRHHWRVCGGLDLQRLRLSFQNIADEIVGNKKQAEAEFSIKKLLYYGSAFLNKNAIALPKIERAMRRVPDLSSLQNINNVIVMAPEIFVAVLMATVEYCKKRIAAGEAPASSFVGDVCI